MIISFWIFITFLLGVNVYWVIRNEWHIINFIMAAFVIAFTSMIDDVLWFYFNSSFQINNNVPVIYHLFFQYVGYPTIAIFLIKTLVKRNSWLHIIIWSVVLSGLEYWFYPLSIVRYAERFVFPHSVLVSLVIMASCWLVFRIVNNTLRQEG